MRRGEIWWANLPPPMKRRPVLLLSRNLVYERRAMITVAPVTSTIRRIDSMVPLGPEDGMPATCVVSLDDIQTISKTLLTDRITTLSD